MERYALSVKQSTIDNLRKIHAILTELDKRESMTAIVERLVKEELERVKEERSKQDS